MTTETKSFLGIPVAGDITYSKPPREQYGLDRLAPLMQAVLDDPGVRRFGWKQYTPYFNDGDPCVFSVHTLWADPADAVRPRVHLAPLPGRHNMPCCDKPRSEVPQGSRVTDSVGEVTCGLLSDDEDDDDLRADGVEYDDRWGKYPGWGANKGDYVGPDKDRYDRLLALSEAVESGHYDNVLLEHFGDHASITVTREGIEVEEYSHD